VKSVVRILATQCDLRCVLIVDTAQILRDLGWLVACSLARSLAPTLRAGGCKSPRRRTTGNAFPCRRQDVYQSRAHSPWVSKTGWMGDLLKGGCAGGAWGRNTLDTFSVGGLWNLPGRGQGLGPYRYCGLVVHAGVELSCSFFLAISSETSTSSTSGTRRPGRRRRSASDGGSPGDDNSEDKHDIIQVHIDLYAVYHHFLPPHSSHDDFHPFRHRMQPDSWQ